MKEIKLNEMKMFIYMMFWYLEWQVSQKLYQ